MFKVLNINEFDKIYSIMENSFPSDEYRPYNEQKALLKNREYKIYSWYTDSGEPAGFISVWEFDDFLYVEHFAVSLAFRGAGIGSKVLDEIKKITSNMVCLEVELPDSEMSRRRIEFYKRNGFFLNEYPYMQPPISKGKNPIPLLIMTSGRFIEECEFNKIKSTLYSRVYKIKTAL